MGAFSEFLAEKFSGRIKRIRVRVKNGKVQRNVRLSNVKGFRMHAGRLVRMSSQEKLHRKRGARRAKIKMRSKKARIAMKRKRSMRKRHGMGL